MKLLLDLGNSRLKWGLLEDDEIVAGGEQDYAALNASEPLARVTGVDECLGCSVVADRERERVSKAFQVVLGHAVEWVDATHPRANPDGLRCAYDDPSKLGADRWFAILAAHARSPEGACVVDCGTAVTIDATAEGEHLGGVIFPGFVLMERALCGETARIRDLANGRVGIRTRSTADAVLTGVTLGLAGAVDRIVEEYLAMLPDSAPVLLTGGSSGTLVARCDTEFTPAVDLVLEGLALVAARGTASEATP